MIVTPASVALAAIAVGVDASYFLHPKGVIERPLPVIESLVTASALQAISARATGAEVVVTGFAGVMTLEESSDLRAWQNAMTTNSSSSEVRFEIPNSSAMKFFRVRQGN